MPLVSMRELLDHAAENGYGIPAFNVNNLEQVQAVMEAAKETGAPVILQASAGARKYAGEAFIKHLIQAAVEAYPQIPLVMHQDHGQSPDVCKGAINLGFSSVMMDGSLEADGKIHRQLRLQRRRHAQGGRHGAQARRHRRRRTRLPGLAGDHEGRQGRRPRHRSHDDARAAADRSRSRPPTSSSAPSSTPWPSPSAPATAPTSSPASPPATSWRSTASRKSTAAFRTPTW